MINIPLNAIVICNVYSYKYITYSYQLNITVCLEKKNASNNSKFAFVHNIIMNHRLRQNIDIFPFLHWFDFTAVRNARFCFIIGVIWFGHFHSYYSLLNISLIIIHSSVVTIIYTKCFPLVRSLFCLWIGVWLLYKNDLANFAKIELQKSRLLCKPFSGLIWTHCIFASLDKSFLCLNNHFFEVKMEKECDTSVYYCCFANAFVLVKVEFEYDCSHFSFFLIILFVNSYRYKRNLLSLITWDAFTIRRLSTNFQPFVFVPFVILYFYK